VGRQVGRRLFLNVLDAVVGSVHPETPEGIVYTYWSIGGEIDACFDSPARGWIYWTRPR
jgi:hypothetical protein